MCATTRRAWAGHCRIWERPRPQTTFRIDLNASVLFDTGQASLKRKARNTLIVRHL